MISFIIRQLLKTAIIGIKFPVDGNSAQTTRNAKKMHILQPKHVKLKKEEADAILKKFNISKAQFPKILSTDPGLPEGCNAGDIIKIERKDPDSDKVNIYYRVVV